MGKKYLLIEGKQVEVSDDIVPVMKSEMLCFGQVVEYQIGNEKRIGKITGARDGKILISKVANKSRAGYQFSMTDVDAVNKAEIVRRLEI
jgi:hypothetical protein